MTMIMVILQSLLNGQSGILAYTVHPTVEQLLGTGAVRLSLAIWTRVATTGGELQENHSHHAAMNKTINNFLMGQGQQWLVITAISLINHGGRSYNWFDLHDNEHVFHDFLLGN